MSVSTLPVPTDERRHRWKVLGVGVAANGSFAAALTGLPTTAVLMRADYHLDAPYLGLTLGAMGLGIAISELPWGVATDRWGDRRVLQAGLGLTGLILAAMALFVTPQPGFIPSVANLVLALFLVGFLGGSLNGSSGRAVMAWFAEGERGLAMSIRQMALPAGGALGALLLPSLAASTGFPGVFGVLAGLCLVSTFFVWLWLHEPPVRIGSDGKPAPTPEPTQSLLGNSEIWRMVLGLGSLCAPQIAVVTFASVFLNDFAQIGLPMISVSVVAIQIGAAILRVWSGHFTDRRRNRRPFLKAAGLVTAAVFALLAALVTYAPEQTTVIVAVLVIGGIIASCWHGIAFTELATIAGLARTGTALGLGNSFAFGTYFLTPLAIPHLLALGDWSLVWGVMVICALLASGLFPKRP